MVSISISKCGTDVKGNRDASHLTFTFDWLFSGQRCKPSRRLWHSRQRLTTRPPMKSAKGDNGYCALCPLELCKRLQRLREFSDDVAILILAVRKLAFCVVRKLAYCVGVA
jgi:hypothetical protein